MSKVKTCDARCHNAKGKICLCWCGGKFHGKANQPARDEFIETIRNGKVKMEPGNSFDLGNSNRIYGIKEPEEFEEMANIF